MAAWQYSALASFLSNMKYSLGSCTMNTSSLDEKRKVRELTGTPCRIIIPVRNPL